MTTNIELKNQIDSQIKNKTTASSITKDNVADNMKQVVDYVDQETENLPKKVYAATISQSGTNAPTVNTLYKNSFLDNIIWSRFGEGQYIGTITTNEFGILTFFPTQIAKIGGLCTANTTSENTFILRTWSVIDYAYKDNLLDNSQFKIEVYN